MEQRYGRVLDSTLEEIMPALRPAPVDEPTEAADHLLKKSQLYPNLEALFNAALARSGALNSDEDFPDYSALAEEANLTLAEYEAVAMSVDGWRAEDIAKFQHVSLGSVRSAYRRGVHKIRKFISISASATFPIVLYEGAVDADQS